MKTSRDLLPLLKVSKKLCLIMPTTNPSKSPSTVTANPRKLCLKIPINSVTSSTRSLNSSNCFFKGSNLNSFYSHIYKKQREQRLAAKKKIGGGRVKVQQEDTQSDKSSDISRGERTKNHQESVVMEKLEKGEENLFNIIRSSKRSNIHPLPMEPNPRKVLHTINSFNEENKVVISKK